MNLSFPIEHEILKFLKNFYFLPKNYFDFKISKIRIFIKNYRWGWLKPFSFQNWPVKFHLVRRWTVLYFFVSKRNCRRSKKCVIRVISRLFKRWNWASLRWNGASRARKSWIVVSPRVIFSIRLELNWSIWWKRECLKNLEFNKRQKWLIRTWKFQN